MLNHYAPKQLRIFFRILIISAFINWKAQAQYPPQTPITTDINYAIHGYYEWLPMDYSSQSTQKYPLLIFLHGIGEIGNGSQRSLPQVLVNGPPKLINQKTFPTSFNVGGQNFSFIVISPQLNSNARDYTVIDDLIDYLVKKYRVDPDRIYLTGLSMGGGIAWIYAGGKPANANRLAAFAEVCGNSVPYPASVKIIAKSNLPVKAFHNSGDPTVPVSNSIDWVNQLNAFVPPINPPAQITIFNANSHDAWSKAYDPNYKENGMNVYEWMLQYQRGRPPGGPPKVPKNKPPVANAGTDQRIQLPTNSVTVSGGASSDPDGSIASYSWTKLSGPANYVINSPNSAQTIISSLVQGTYQFLLTVTDNQGATSTAQITITVSAASNQPPVANAGADQQLVLPVNSIIANGSASIDPNGNIKTYAWRQVSGPGAATIVSPGAAISVISGLSAGTYIFTLTVTDADGASDVDSLNVVVKGALNSPPVADAGTNKTLTLPANSVQLDGSKSKDPDGTISSYVWSQLSGPSTASFTNANSPSAVASGLIAGQYVFELTVTDNKGATGKAQVKITVVDAANQPPIANAGSGKSITLPVNSVSLDGSASTDPEGGVLSYSWSEVAGPSSASFTNAGAVSATASNLVAGQYTFQLSVSDNKGASSQAQVKITVLSATNQPPVANAGSGKSITLPVNSVSLDGSKSKDPDGTISSYVWSQLSGPSTASFTNANSPSAVASGFVAGQYTFQITVQDNKGATGQAQTKITVSPAANVLPIANAGANQVIVLPVNSVNLDGSASSDPNGSVSAYSWTEVSGPASASVSAANSAKAKASNLVQGTYVFRLSITDNSGATASDDVTITVNGPINKQPLANAGANFAITLPISSVVLDGSASGDADGSITSFVWSQESGPAQAALSASGTARPTAGGLIQGTYVFRLVVTDNDGATASDSVIVTVNAASNKLPIANAGANLTIVLPTNSANLDGSGSQDLDGSITSYSWTLLTGPTKVNFSTPGAANTTISGLVEGTYLINLRVTDNHGATGNDQLVITVSAQPNQAPLADAGPSASVTLPQHSFKLDGSKSSDPDGSIQSYYWTQISGPSAAAFSNSGDVQPTVTNLVEGQYVFQLMVKDNSGASASALVKITVVPASNLAPISNAGNDITLTLPQNSTILDGGRSFDPDGNISSYAWKKLSGADPITLTGSNTAKLSIGGLQQGTYLFELDVTDNKGAMGTDLVTVQVNAPERRPVVNQAPFADAGNDTSVQISDNGVLLNGSGSYDPDGQIFSYSWNQESGPNVANIETAESVTTPISNLIPGNYVFQLTVTDDQGAIDTASVRIVVGNNLRYLEQIVLYPNPAHDLVHFRLTSDIRGMVKINVYDLSGKIVRSMQMHKDQNILDNSINVADFSAGMYTIQFIIGDNGRFTSKLIKQ